MEETRMKMFANTPIWKLVLKMSIPSIIIMSIIGLYTFSDSILAINFANDSINLPSIDTKNAKAVVRQIMVYSQPTFNLLLAITMMLSVGISTRVSINLGRNDKKRAINTMKTGMFFGILIMAISTPLFIFTAKPWVEFQLGTPNHTLKGPNFQVYMNVRNYIIDQSFNYIWIMALANPIYFFSTLISSLFRVEGRMKEAGLAMILPVLFNLLMDWIFMGPANMGVEGAALATALADLVTFIIILLILIKIRKESIITFKNMFGRFDWKSIIGILIVGISPFFRNFAQSITGSVQQNIIADVQRAVYPNAINANGPGQMVRLITSVFPIFGLFFPMIFGFVQGASPIAGFNYGAKNIERVKLTIKYASLYSLIFSLTIYLLSTTVLIIPLLKLLGVEPNLFHKSRIVVSILMLGAPLFVPAVAGMILFTSTDRVLFSFISSTARGFIVFLPMLFIFRELATTYPQQEYLFWALYPSVSIISGIIVIIIGSFTWKRLEEKHKTLDERILEINKKLSKRINKKDSD